MQGLRDENHTLATARSVLQFQVNELTLQLSSALSDRDFIEEKLAASRLELQTLESTRRRGPCWPCWPRVGRTMFMFMLPASAEGPSHLEVPLFEGESKAPARE